MDIDAGGYRTDPYSHSMIPHTTTPGVLMIKGSPSSRRRSMSRSMTILALYPPGIPAYSVECVDHIHVPAIIQASNPLCYGQTFNFHKI